MIFESLKKERPTEAIPRFAWYPCENGWETQKDLEARLIKQWLNENLSSQEYSAWRRELLNNESIKPEQLLNAISSHHTPELVELLFPRKPQLFLTARQFTLSHLLLADACHPTFSPEILQQCLYSHTAHLSATCLFALTGAMACLESMLEQGADPDGLDSPASWSYFELGNDRILPVTPMDCALLADQEDCQLVLEMFGGKTLAECISS